VSSTPQKGTTFTVILPEEPKLRLTAAGAEEQQPVISEKL
jgi:hypothetical protein